MLVVRDEEGRLRAYRNVCRHRASRLLSGSGQCKAAIRCRYHGWTYRLDGSLIGVPEGMAFGDKLDKSRLGLMPVRVEEMCGLIFVNLDAGATALADLVGDLPQRLAPYRIESLEQFAPGEGTQPANWKVVVDNYIVGQPEAQHAGARRGRRSRRQRPAGADDARLSLRPAVAARGRRGLVCRPDPRLAGPGPRH